MASTARTGRLADLLRYIGFDAVSTSAEETDTGQTGIMFAMSRDGLVPDLMAKLWEKTQTPVFTTALFGALIAVMAALLPLKEIAELVNIGTLFAFVIVNIGVVVLRRTQPDLERGFRVPFVPAFPVIGVPLCVYLMTELPGALLVLFFVTAIGACAMGSGLGVMFRVELYRTEGQVTGGFAQQDMVAAFRPGGRDAARS